MICPNCEFEAQIQRDGYYLCPQCKAQEKPNTTGDGSMWILNGRVIAAPLAVRQKLEEKRIEQELDLERSQIGKR